jgi:hypothetical protein
LVIRTRGCSVSRSLSRGSRCGRVYFARGMAGTLNFGLGGDTLSGLRHRTRRGDLFRLQFLAGVARRPHGGQRRTRPSGAGHISSRTEPRNQRGGFAATC